MRWSILVLAAAVVVTAAAVAAVVLGAGGSAPDARTAAAAGLPRLAVAPTGSDAGRCTPSAPCRTFDRAYRVAVPGQVVEVASGTYPSQMIPYDPAKTSSADVVFQPVAGGSVTLAGRLDVFGRHVEFRNLRFASSWYARQGAEDVTFRDTTTRTFSIGSARGISILGGRVGPLTATSGDPDPKVAKSSPFAGTAPTDILIDGVAFRDILREPGSGLHIECLQVGSAAGLVIRDSTFENCATQGVFVSSWGPSYPLRDITIEANLFGSVPDGYHALKLNIVPGYAPCENCTIRGNRTSKPIAVNVEAPGSSVLVTDNVTSSADLAPPGWCDSGRNGVVWDRNAFESRPTCGMHATLVP
jgi:hypothetical protein